MRPAKVWVVAGVSLLAVALAGCDELDKVIGAETVTVTETPGPENAPAADDDQQDSSDDDSGGGSPDYFQGPTISQDHSVVVRTCGRKAILISGDANAITLLGMCTSVLVSGDGNKVILGGVERLSVSGDGNTITYWPSTATLTDSGNGNTYFKR
ncbi:DUF3060 domain-containing protein [Gordonia pseudamarae]|uniref:DUF3060 domain-containing protein n=1 Tax=Gordonia pseudamarae TaxID=2831662 RepID=A0ABX6IID4_9ACTN|nr:MULTISPECIES: DUF3060 domain-containing protein [Gordonia]MBD0020973.1 DUF3060 domain-containing protein [Gordonia sp. (in: high G+C Gram-positive bacteria)]QHN26182.1 DUF3060 domain-containing protein [Gordonia pseudamarae]QHN35075.1 DUF3060 domain-containing protein [Gordonia pseudamarae]